MYTNTCMELIKLITNTKNNEPNFSIKIPTSQMEQVFFGFFYSSEVAFTTYLYAKVDDKQYYQKITSLVKASMLFGRFLSGLIAQTIVSTHLLNEVYLLYISIFSMYHKINICINY